MVSASASSADPAAPHATTVLVTGFGPFGSHQVNPSGQVALGLDGAVVAGARVVGRRFDTSSATIATAFAAALDEVAPDLVICLGLAPGRPALSLERTAVNVCDYPIPDSDGTIHTDVAIIDGGPDGSFSRLPIRAILGRWREEHVPGHISDTAGTYLCNQLFYLACAEGAARGIATGFIHIPHTPESAAVAGEPAVATMAAETIRRGVELAVETCLDPSPAGSAPVLTGAVA